MSTDRMPHVSSLWAFLSVDKDGDEAVLGANIGPDGAWLAMIAADEKRVQALRPFINRLCAHAGLTVRLVKFTNRIDIEVLGQVGPVRKPANDT